ncbi:hypothetical protein D030_1115A, partial [Vibrio parahaemolyticus AQ3810]
MLPKKSNSTARWSAGSLRFSST